MRECGEGSANGGARWRAEPLVVGLALCCAVGLLGGSFLAGCANGSSQPDTRVAAQAEPAKPEQVVQRIEPALDPGPAESKGNPRGPSAGDERAAPKAPTISAKHLEAELNRLEAELK